MRGMRKRRQVGWGVVVGAGAALMIGVVLPLVDCWHLAGAVLHPDFDKPFDLTVLGSAPGVVRLPATRETRQRGTFGLQWRHREGGVIHAGVLGAVTAADGGTVVRRLESTEVPRVDDEARRLVVVWDSNPRAALGLGYEEVRYPGPLGPMPAWLVRGSRPNWVIQVHGRGSGRAEGLRAMGIFHRLGYPVLDIAYRNGRDAPPSPDGCGHLGDTEWQDLQAAVGYAGHQGAKGVILYGCSQGGGIVEAYLTRGRWTERVRAAVLDCPALDWRAIFDFQTRRGGYPRLLARAVGGMLWLRSGIALDRLDFLSAIERQGGPRQPVLILHGTADATVPFASSARFAAAWPERVRLAAVEGAEHDEAWNVDPEGYERVLAEFLRAR